MLGFYPLAAAPLGDDEGVTPVGTTVTIFLTSGSSWTVPADWNSSDNMIEVIGAGGSGGNAFSNSGITAKATGGGGGAYARIHNLSLTPNSSVSYTIGAGGAGATTGPTPPTYVAGNAGGDTWFQSTGTVLAKGGSGGVTTDTSATTLPDTAGGSAASSVGDVKYDGGAAGGVTTTTITTCATGGGGAAGRYGAGLPSVTATASGSTDGGAGDAGKGGAGGKAGATAGQDGVEYGDGYGSGGGPRSIAAAPAGQTFNARIVGNYGAGGGARALSGSSGTYTFTSEDGANGLIVITYTATGGPIFANGEASLSSSGSATFLSTKTLSGSSQLSSSGSASFVADRTTSASTLLSGSGALSSTASLTKPASFNATASGALSASSGFRFFASASFASSATASFVGSIINYGFAAFEASSATSFIETFRYGGRVQSSATDLLRETEGGDQRVTEDGQPRLAENVSQNSIICAMIVSGDLIRFSSQISVKNLGDWQTSDLYVKANGVWNQLGVNDSTKAYMKISGSWKRIA